MRRFREFLGLAKPLAGLENILEQVASGDIGRDDAAQQMEEDNQQDADEAILIG